MHDTHRSSQLASRLLLVLAVALIGLGAAARGQIWRRSEAALETASRTFRIIDGADQMALHLERARASVSNPVKLTREAQQVRAHGAALATLARNDPVQAGRVALARRLVDADLARLGEGHATSDDGGQAIEAVLAAERKTAVTLNGQFRSQWRATLLALAVILAGLMAAAGALLLFLRRIGQSERALETAVMELSAAGA